MTSNNNTIKFKSNINSGKVTNKVNIDGGDNNTIINDVTTSASHITLKLKPSVKGKNNKVKTNLHLRNVAGSNHIKVKFKSKPKIKVSLKRKA